MASEWAGDQEWTERRKGCTSRMDMIDFGTFAWVKARHSVAHKLIV